MQPEARKYSNLLRLTGEALAIVLSILLAFAIDAWWQERAEYREETSAAKLPAATISAVRVKDLQLAACHSVCNVVRLTYGQSHDG